MLDHDKMIITNWAICASLAIYDSDFQRILVSKIVVKYVFVEVWGRGPLSIYCHHCYPHHWKGGEINLRNKKSVSMWSLQLLWLHVFSNNRGLGLEWNWNRRLLMLMREKMIQLCTNQPRLTVSKKWILGNSKTPMLIAPSLWCEQSFCIAQCPVDFLRRLLVHVQQFAFVHRLDAVAVWERFWRERRSRGTRKLWWEQIQWCWQWPERTRNI